MGRKCELDKNPFAVKSRASILGRGRGGGGETEVQLPLRKGAIND